MPLDDSFSERLIALERYLTEQLSTEERAQLEARLSEHPEESRMLELLRNGVVDPYGDIPAYNPEARAAAVVDFSLRNARRVRRESGVRPMVFRSGWMARERWATSTRAFWSACVVGLLILGAGAGVWGRGKLGKTDRESVAAMSVYTANHGERKTITLRDGTTVTLNVGSRLRVPHDFGTNTRTIQLDGEARFTVTHHGNLPFSVDAGGTRTTVLGTVFNVRAYAGESTTQVLVVDGKVNVRPMQVTVPQAIVLTHGELASVTDGQGPVVSRPSDLDQYLAWADGQLIFDRTPVTKVLTELSRWYNLEISISDSVLASRKLSARFDAKSAQSVNEVLSVIATALNARYQRDGRVVQFTPLH